MTAEQIEREYLAFCKSVRQDAMKIMAMANNGRTEEAANAAATLAQSALTQENQFKMRQERHSGHYDLAALRVDATSGSNSETGFEDRG